ncbi:YraN family protein [Faecalibacter bovis]|uniref:UPF0102 protein J9309_06300 n=1 Tax=Faecalibacter bovis TaxID=2898187 RepID=A0ABX7XG95_9FLAO|nr:YraN family protein [Faecalibacter bovis]MBS7332006.1 YraN family protein [Weeksellaceae bacterium]QTV06914.1 YraN family protein [Faecalibacter bovis]
MSKSFDFGREAENFAADYFEKNGYEILVRNYIYQKAEIDLIIQKNQTLIVVEVKARKYNPLLLPEESVNQKKKKLIISAAHQFISINNVNADVRFDILALEKKDNIWLINHIEDAFSPIEL